MKEKIFMYLWSKATDSQRYIDAQSDKLEELAKRHFGNTAATVGGVNAPKSVDITLLREQHPQYLDLDASNGLDIYVWQMAENSYSFRLLPHSATQRDRLSTELLNLQGTDASTALPKFR